MVLTFIFVSHLFSCCSLHCSSLFHPLPLYHSLTFSNASVISASLVFLWLNWWLLPPSLSHFAFDILFITFICSLLFLTLFCLNPSISHMFHPLIFCNPPPNCFCISSTVHQCGHNRWGEAAPARGGGLPPWRVCQCLLPWLTGAAKPGRELHAHTGLCALWHSKWDDWWVQVPHWHKHLHTHAQILL